MTPTAARQKSTETDPTVEDLAKALSTLRRYAVFIAVALGLGGGGTMVAWASIPATVQSNTDRIGRLERSQQYTECFVRSQVEHTDPAACRFLDPDKPRQ